MQQNIKFKELNTLETVLINLILNRLFSIEETKKRVISYVQEEKYTKAKEESDKLYLMQYDKTLSDLKEAFFDNAEVATLTKIANGEKFISEWHFDQDKAILPIELLRTFSSYDKIINSNPKAQIAKKLGATIIA